MYAKVKRVLFRFCRRLSDLFSGLPPIVHNMLITLVFLTLAYLLSSVLLRHTGGENNSALVFTLAVVIISALSTGYVPGIISAFLSAVSINYFFMYPYAQFNMTFSGYPVAFASFLAIACIVSALTTRVKLQAAEAKRREQQAKTLYEQNQQLTEENKRIELEAARESIRSNILRSVSHDLRTPLTAISGAASVLLESDTTYSLQDLYLIQDIKENADDLTSLVENLLSITKLRQNTLQLTKVPEVLEEVAADALIKLRKRFPDYPIELVLPNELIVLPMEPMLIRQVILNLLENAIRHSGDREHIRLILSVQDNWAQVSVCDRGRGLSEDTLEYIRTHRDLPLAESGDSSRGMGIGLSVCRSIIHVHGGTFHASNQPEGGAQFTFKLPMETEEPCHVG